MRAYRGRARNGALARVLEPPERPKRLRVGPWGTRAWLVVLALAVAALLARYLG